MNRFLGSGFASFVCGAAMVACGAIEQDIFSRSDPPAEAGVDGTPQPTADANLPDTGSDADDPLRKCVPPGVTVELLRLPFLTIDSIVPAGRYLYYSVRGLNALVPQIVQFDLVSKTSSPEVAVPASASFGVDDTGIYFVASWLDDGLRILHHTGGMTESLDASIGAAESAVFAPKVDRGAAFVTADLAGYWLPGTSLRATMAPGGTGAVVAVAAGPGGTPMYVLKNNNSGKTDLFTSASAIGFGTVPGDFSAMAHAAGSVVLGAWEEPAGPKIARVLDGSATVSSSISVAADVFGGGPLGRVESIAATDDAMVWAQGETPKPPRCTSGYGTYQIRTHALPDGSPTSPAPTQIANTVVSQEDCRPPAVAIDECNVYWGAGERVMAKAR
jgi:hypothetical protein